MRHALPVRLAWLVFLTAVWLLLIESSSAADIVLGVISAAAMAGGLHWLRRDTPAFVLRPAWLAQAWPLGSRFFRDTWLVFAQLLHQARGQAQPGTIRAISVPGTFTTTSLAAGGTTFTITANSLTPNGIVLDVDGLEGLALQHQLVPRSLAETRREFILPV
ncbi:MAG TPA: hypothetical protein VMV93_04975 [Chloroflexota bacterium]|nr:hypothetical protein [Chloroflexota bacterium]